MSDVNLAHAQNDNFGIGEKYQSANKELIRCEIKAGFKAIQPPDSNRYGNDMNISNTEFGWALERPRKNFKPVLESVLLRARL